jgi:hypothetical protein
MNTSTKDLPPHFPSGPCGLFKIHHFGQSSIFSTGKMGFLTEGDTLRWEDAKKYVEYIRKHGIEQFLSIWRNTKHRTNDALLWGDEVRPCKSPKIFGPNRVRQRISPCLTRFLRFSRWSIYWFVSIKKIIELNCRCMDMRLSLNLERMRMNNRMSPPTVLIPALVVVLRVRVPIEPGIIFLQKIEFCASSLYSMEHLNANYFKLIFPFVFW